MRIVCQQTIPMKYHALFIIFEKAAKFEMVVCCKLYVVLYGLTIILPRRVERITLFELWLSVLCVSSLSVFCDCSIS